MLDPVQLDQMLLNLAINARDAMQGLGTLQVEVHPAQPIDAICASCRQRFAGAYVELAVADSGPGIAPKVLERMFEPFFTTKEVGGGNGMGLATVHGIVHECHGHIVVENRAQCGSRFRVLLPPLPGTGNSGAPQAGTGHATPAAAARRAPLKGRVMVVDDEAPVADFMRELLESWGLRAVAITSPRAALQAFKADPDAFDLVVTDLAMPGTTGFLLARELMASRPGLPVVLYTGHIDPIAQRELESAGIRALLPKPVDPDRLHSLLKTLLP
jgi:CheY-like chemotaxis protein